MRLQSGDFVTSVTALRQTAGCTWTDHKTNTEIAKELHVTPVLDKIQDTRENGYNMYIKCHVTNYPD
jgi:hypothetical protein